MCVICVYRLIYEFEIIAITISNLIYTTDKYVGRQASTRGYTKETESEWDGGKERSTTTTSGINQNNANL